MLHTTVSLPANFDRPSLNLFLGQIFDGRILRGSNFVFDFSGLTFIRPAGVVAFANVIELIKARNLRYQFKFPQSRAGSIYVTEPIRYLNNCGFFRAYGGDIPEPAALPPTTIPIQRIAHSHAYGWFEGQFSAWRRYKTDLNSHALSSVKLCFLEIFNNIQDHSGETSGIVFAQFYPFRKRINISISDFGLGIPMTVRRVYPDASDADAIEIATRARFTAGTTGRNQGLGLDTLIQEIAGSNGGAVTIRSHRGFINCASRSGNLRRSVHAVSGHYPGTMIDIEVCTNTEYDHEQAGEMEW